MTILDRRIEFEIVFYLINFPKSSSTRKDKANANMRQLSGGMKRRVLVAQALVHKPQVIEIGRASCRERVLASV